MQSFLRPDFGLYEIIPGVFFDGMSAADLDDFLYTGFFTGGIDVF
jgi:hypothetical protein